MSAALGIDAAWTMRQPSGVALVEGGAGDWRLLRVASSYAEFGRTSAKCAEPPRPAGGLADVPGLLAVAADLAGRQIDLVAIDIPLARCPITARRDSDNKVSVAYGARQCGTHSPTAERPGDLSDTLRHSFDEAGYPLLTETISPPGLIEVYPHPALVELTDAPRRLPYKVAKVGTYWPSCSREMRRARLLAMWSEILAHLERKVSGVRNALPLPGIDTVGWRLKAFEDALDAVVCAWVAIAALEGQAMPFGDKDSAIWIPRARRGQNGSPTSAAE